MYCKKPENAKKEMRKFWSVDQFSKIKKCYVRASYLSALNKSVISFQNYYSSDFGRIWSEFPIILADFFFSPDPFHETNPDPGRQNEIDPNGSGTVFFTKKKKENVLKPYWKARCD